MLRKLTVLLPLMAIFGAAFAPEAFAADGGTRLLEGQGEYLGDTASAFEVAAKGFLFVMGLGAIGFSGWHMLSDYVFAKSDHEKKFSIGKLIVGMVIGSILCVPYGAIMIGSDITGVQDEAAEGMDAGDFNREGE